MGVDGGGHPESGPKPDTILETHKVPESHLPATSVQPGVPDTLLAALKGASIVDEHRALMGAVIEKIQSAESGWNESCVSLIRGFEVCFMSSWENVMV